MKIIHEVLEKMASLSKPRYEFMAALLSTMLSMRGKMNFRNMARYTDYDEKTFSRNFAKDFDFLEFNMLALNKIITQKNRHMLAYDQSFVDKAGKKTYGKRSFWNGSQGISERGLEVCGLALVDVDKNIAYPLSVAQTPTKDEIIKLTNNPEATRMSFYAHDLELKFLRINALNCVVKHVACDAAFAKEGFVTATTKSGLHVVTKLRVDANLRDADFIPSTGRGRPRKYGKKVNSKDIESYSFAMEVNKEISLHEGIFYHTSLKRKIKVIRVVRTDKSGKQSTALLMSTDLEQSAREIYDFYKARFQLEFIFRDAKQSTGLTDCQARSKEKLNHHFNSSFSALLIVKVQEAEAYINPGIRFPFSMYSHKQRNYNENLIKVIISKLDLDVSLINSHLGLRSVIEYGVIQC